MVEVAIIVGLVVAGVGLAIGLLIHHEIRRAADAIERLEDERD